MTLYRMVNNGKIIREAVYDQIAYFEAGDKYVTAHYGEGRELLLDITLKQLRLNHPELVYIHRSALVKPDLIESIRRDPDEPAYYVTLIGGQTQWVSRRRYPSIRDLMQARKELQA